jgi:tRNA threonylcarbamoyladenosine biosynthesis protein TsaE
MPNTILPCSQFQFSSGSPEETKRWGARLAKETKTGDIILFLANLGCGKTTFIQGFIKKLGVQEEALSPTFIIAQTFEGRRVIHHLDFYRLSPKEILDMGVQDYLLGQGAIEPGVVLIEWADRAKELWPRERLEIHIKIDPKTKTRLFRAVARGKRYVQLLSKWGKSK